MNETKIYEGERIINCKILQHIACGAMIFTLQFFHSNNNSSTFSYRNLTPKGWGHVNDQVLSQDVLDS